MEQVQKSEYEFILDYLVLNHDDEGKVFQAGAYSLRYVRDLVKDKGIDVGLGGQATFNRNPSGLISS
ncbi:MAG: hypothetical protein M3367_09970 [Acidobacteriota bacterium]|nr:hypothetical protein [Acidobacteriota bacterium]